MLISGLQRIKHNISSYNISNLGNRTNQSARDLTAIVYLRSIRSGICRPIRFVLDIRDVIGSDQVRPIDFPR